MRSSSRYFRRHNSHPRVRVLCTLSAISFFPSDNFFKISLRFKRITWALLLRNKRYRSPCSFGRKRAFIFYMCFIVLRA